MAQSEQLASKGSIAFPRILVVVPAFNEEESVRNVVDEIKGAAPDWDVLVVNDASTDRTGETAKESGAKVLDLPVNLRIGGAVQTGFEYARRQGYDLVVQVDGDGQHDPKYLTRLIASILEGKADIIIGSRYLDGNNERPPLLRNLGIRYFSWLSTRLTRQKISDCSSGFRALNRKACCFFAKHYPVDFPDAEALILASRAGLRIAEVSVKFRERNHGKSSLRSWRMLYYPFKEMLAIIILLTRKAEAADD